MSSPLNPFNMPAGASLNPDPYAPAILTYSFTTSVNSDCWDSTITSFEELILLPFLSPDLEELRALLLQYTITPYTDNQAARAVMQMAHETELTNIIQEFAPITDEIKNAKLCHRNKYLDIDLSLRSKNYLFDKALTTLVTHKLMPDSYRKLFQIHSKSAYPKYRIATVCAIICYAVKMRDIDSTL
jgi:hypothetical protein